MAVKHKGTVSFNEAVNWLKFKSIISKYNEIAPIIGVSIAQFDMIRAFRRKIKEEEILRLIKKYPETVKFFKGGNQYEKTEKETPSDIITVQKELIEAQKKIISSKESDIEAQTKLYFEMNERLLSEIKALTKKLKDKGVID